MRHYFNTTYTTEANSLLKTNQKKGKRNKKNSTSTRTHATVSYGKSAMKDGKGKGSYDNGWNWLLYYKKYKGKKRKGPLTQAEKNLPKKRKGRKDYDGEKTCLKNLTEWGGGDIMATHSQRLP